MVSCLERGCCLCKRPAFLEQYPCADHCGVFGVGLRPQCPHTCEEDRTLYLFLTAHQWDQMSVRRTQTLTAGVVLCLAPWTEIIGPYSIVGTCMDLFEPFPPFVTVSLFE